MDVRLDLDRDRELSNKTVSAILLYSFEFKISDTKDDCKSEQRPTK